jgi:hypothetical protein
MLKKKKYQNQRKRRKKTGDFKDDFSLIIFDYFWEKTFYENSRSSTKNQQNIAKPV